MSSILKSLTIPSQIPSNAKTTLLFSLIGLSQGLISSFAVVFSYIYLDTYLLSPAQATFLDTSIQLPWVLRPIWIGLSNYFKPFGYQKKPFIICMTFIGAFSLLRLGLDPSALPIGSFMLFLIGLSLCFLNCLVEEIISKGVQSSGNTKISDYERQKESSRHSTFFFVAKYVGKFIGAAMMALRLEESDRGSFLVGTSVCLLLAGLVAFSFPEKRIRSSQGSSMVQLVDKTVSESTDTGIYSAPQPEITREQERNGRAFTVEKFKKSVRFMRQPVILMAVLLIFASGITLQSQQTKFYFYTQKLQLEPDYMGFLKLIECISVLIAMCIYNGFLTQANPKILYTITLSLSGLFLLGDLFLVCQINEVFGISSKLSAFALTILQGLIMELKSFPIVVLAKGICPNELESMLLPLLVSIEGIGALLSSLMGGTFTAILGIQREDFSRLWILTLLGGIFSLGSLLIVKKTDFRKAIEHAEAYENPWAKPNVIIEPTTLGHIENTILEGRAYEILEI